MGTPARPSFRDGQECPSYFWLRLRRFRERVITRWLEPVRKPNRTNGIEQLFRFTLLPFVVSVCLIATNLEAGDAPSNAEIRAAVENLGSAEFHFSPILELMKPFAIGTEFEVNSVLSRRRFSSGPAGDRISVAFSLTW